MEHKEATRLVAGKVRWTGAKDQDGIPIRLSAHDYERLSREEIDAYEATREQHIADERERANDADDLERFTERFVAAGGKKADAPAAFRAHRSRQASEAAGRAEEAAMQSARVRVRQVL